MPVSIRIPRAGGPVTMSLTLSSDATIADVEAAVRQTGEINPTKPISVLHAGRPLCSSDTLASLGDAPVLTCVPAAPAASSDAPTPAPAPAQAPAPAPAPAAAAANPFSLKGGGPAFGAGSSWGAMSAGRTLAPPPAAAAAPAAGLVPPRPTAPTLPTPGKIYVKWLTGKVLELTYVGTMTVIGVKRELERRGEGETKQMRLIFAGKELRDDTEPLSAYQIAANSTLHLVMRNLGPAPPAARPLGFKPVTSGPVTHPRTGKFVGLINQGATCYLNSLIQALFMTPDFRRGLRAAPPSGTLLRACKALFESLHSSPRTVTTQALTTALNWGPVSRQQDVHEFWCELCQRIEHELAAPADAGRTLAGGDALPAPPVCLPCGGGGGGEGAAAPTLVEQIFQGKQRDYVTCGSCGRTSHTDDFFQDLKLEVPPEGAAPPGGTDVAAQLRELLKPEEMRGAEQYECVRCARKCDATKGMKLRSLPPVLTLQLKRFHFDRKTLTRHKVNTTVAFPLTLDMRPFITLDDDADADAAPISYEYELYAVLVHTGGASFGHYYALIKDLHADEWHEFNDATVRPIKEIELLRAHGDPKAGTFGGTSAYMLLYRRRDGAAARPHTPPPAAAVADAAAAPAAPPPPETPPSASLARDTKRLRVSSPPPAPPPAYDNADAMDDELQAMYDDWWTPKPRPPADEFDATDDDELSAMVAMGPPMDDDEKREADAMEMISQFNMQNPLPGLPTFNLGPSSRKDEDDEDPNPYGRMGF